MEDTIYIKAYEILSKVIRILTYLYEGSESSVRVGIEHAEWFSADTWVIQEDSLSLFLFNIVLGFTMTKLNIIDDCIEWPGGKRIKDLAYTCDVCLFAKDIEEMKMMTKLVVVETSRWDLR